MKSSEDLPATDPLLFAARHNHRVCNDGHALHDNGEAHEEADGTPHGTEVAIMTAVEWLRKVDAVVCEGGAAPMEAVGVVDMFASGLRKNQVSLKQEVYNIGLKGARTRAYRFTVPRYPSWYDYAGQCKCGSFEFG